MSEIQEDCKKTKIEVLEGYTFSEYSSIKDPKKSQQNAEGKKINKNITLYVDNSPYDMGKDAALSTVATQAYKHVKKIRDDLKEPLQQSVLDSLINKKTQDLKISRDDAKDVWKVILLKHKAVGRDEAPQNKRKKTEIAQPLSYELSDSLIASNNKSIRALISNFSFVKAIMDSACLGETVCISILNGLCQSMRNDGNPNYKGLQIQDLKQIYNPNNDPNDKLLEFLLQMAYCDVYELVSSDVLGAVNSLYTIRAIHDTLPSVSYITIPKAKGGQIGTDIDVFIIAIAITLLMVDQKLLPMIEKFPKDIYDAISKTVFTNKLIFGNITIIDGNQIDKKFLYILQQNIKKFRDFLRNYKGGICNSKTALDDETKSLSKNIMEYTKIFGEWFLKLKDRTGLESNQLTEYDNIINAIGNSYNNKEQWFPILKEHIVWLSFQVFRYVQTKKINSPWVRENYEAGLCRMLNSGFYKSKPPSNLTEMPSLPAWYAALKKVAINEAFIGHDNKSPELLNLVKDVYGPDSYEKQLKWVWSSGEPPTFDDLEREVILKIQQETKCMFFQWCNIDETMFCGNSNMVYDKTVGGVGNKAKSTAEGATVYEIFVNNIGAQRIISTYDLEKYSGQTTIEDVSASVTSLATGSDFSSAFSVYKDTKQVSTKEEQEDAIEGIVVERNELLSENDKILEVQGVICALDRASRNEHPRTIYCTGCLDIPITTKLSASDSITSILSYSFTIGDETCQSNSQTIVPGLKNYKLFKNTEKQKWEEIYKLFDNPLSPCKGATTKFMAYLLTYLTEIIYNFSADQASRLLNNQSFKPITINQQKNKRGTRKAATGGAKTVKDAILIKDKFVVWFNKYKTPTYESQEEVLQLETIKQQFNLLRIIRETLIIAEIISNKGTATDKWKSIFYNLAPSNKFKIGFMIVDIFNKISISQIGDKDEYEGIVGALNSTFLGKTYKKFFTCDVEPYLPDINAKLATDPKTSQNGEVLSENDDSRVGILDGNRPRPIDNSSLPRTNIVMKSTITESNTLLLLQTILSNEIYEIAISESMELFKEEAKDDIEEATHITSDIAMDVDNTFVDTSAFVPQKNIRDEKIKIKHKIKSCHAIITAIDTWQAQNGSSFEQLEDSEVFVKSKMLDTFKEKINNYLEETYDKWCKITDASKQGGGGKKMRGGQPSLDTLQGKLVIYKYDKELEKYIIADYNEVFKQYFSQNENSSSSPNVVLSSAPSVNPLSEPSVEPSYAPSVEPSSAPTVNPSSAPTISATKGGKNNIKRNGTTTMLSYRFKTQRKKHIKLTRKKQRQIKRRKTKKRQMKRKRNTIKR